MGVSPAEILKLQQKTPFTGLRLVLTDGKTYEVRHPERMTVSRSMVYVALSPGPDGVPERGVYCDPIHIVRIEPIEPPLSLGSDENGRE